MRKRKVDSSGVSSVSNKTSFAVLSFPCSANVPLLRGKNKAHRIFCTVGAEDTVTPRVPGLELYFFGGVPIKRAASLIRRVEYRCWRGKPQKKASINRSRCSLTTHDTPWVQYSPHHDPPSTSLPSIGPVHPSARSIHRPGPSI